MRIQALVWNKLVGYNVIAYSLSLGEMEFISGEDGGGGEDHYPENISRVACDALIKESAVYPRTRTVPPPWCLNLTILGWSGPHGASCRAEAEVRHLCLPSQGIFNNAPRLPAIHVEEEGGE